MTNSGYRDKKGRFLKGKPGGPGRRKKAKENLMPSPEEIRRVFFRAFLSVFCKDGSIKDLVDFAKKNQLNARLLIQEVRKLLPELATVESEREGVRIIVANTFLPRPGDKLPEQKKEDSPSPKGEQIKQLEKSETLALDLTWHKKIRDLQNLSKDELQKRLDSMTDSEFDETMKGLKIIN